MDLGELTGFQGPLKQHTQKWGRDPAPASKKNVSFLMIRLIKFSYLFIFSFWRSEARFVGHLHRLLFQELFFCTRSRFLVVSNARGSPSALSVPPFNR